MRVSGLRVWVVALVLASSSGAWAQQRSKPRRDGGGPGQDDEQARKEGEAKHAALAVADQWLELFDAGNFGKAFEEMAPALTKVLDTDQWEAATGAFRTPLGKVLGRRPVAVRYFQSEPTEIVAQLSSTARIFQEKKVQLPYCEWISLQCEARFANYRGTVVEHLQLVKDDDGKWKVLGIALERER